MPASMPDVTDPAWKKRQEAGNLITLRAGRTASGMDGNAAEWATPGSVQEPPAVGRRGKADEAEVPAPQGMRAVPPEAGVWRPTGRAEGPGMSCGAGQEGR